MEASFDKRWTELRKSMENLLPVKRYEHSLSVSYLAAAVAMSYEEDACRAALAGLLHDCAKYIPEKEMLKECRNYQLPVSETERKTPHLLHGKLGAYYARTRYQIQDPEILSAIQFHTTGKPEMTFLEKTIFAADYLELFRKQPTTPELPKLRKLIFHDLDRTVALILKNTVQYLEQQPEKGEMDQMTVLAMQYYMKLVGI